MELAYVNWMKAVSLLHTASLSADGWPPHELQMIID